MSAVIVRGALLATLAVGVVIAVLFLPNQRQSGDSVPAPHEGLTSYCLPDGSGVRVYERPFPSGGQTPLFATVFTGELDISNPAYCKIGT